MQKFKDALPTNQVERKYADDVELGIEKSENPLEKLNIISRLNTYPFMRPKTNVKVICLRASKFQKVVSKTIGVGHDCTILYRPDGEDQAKVYTNEVELDENKGD